MDLNTDIVLTGVENLKYVIQNRAFWICNNVPVLYHQYHTEITESERQSTMNYSRQAITRPRLELATTSQAFPHNPHQFGILFDLWANTKHHLQRQDCQGNWRADGRRSDPLLNSSFSKRFVTAFHRTVLEGYLVRVTKTMHRVRSSLQITAPTGIGGSKSSVLTFIS